MNEYLFSINSNQYLEKKSEMELNSFSILHFFIEHFTFFNEVFFLLRHNLSVN